MKRLRRLDVFLAVGLLVSFFLPWARMYSFAGSGFDFVLQVGGHAYWLVAIPLGCLLMIAAVAYGRNTKLIAGLVGIAPIAMFWLALAEMGNAVFTVMSFGGYISLLLGLWLFFSALNALGAYLDAALVRLVSGHGAARGEAQPRRSGSRSE